VVRSFFYCSNINSLSKYFQYILVDRPLGRLNVASSELHGVGRVIALLLGREFNFKLCVNLPTTATQPHDNHAKMMKNKDNPSAARQAGEGSDTSMTNNTSSVSVDTQVITSTQNDMTELQFEVLAEVEASPTDTKECNNLQAVSMPVALSVMY